jgi:hypothetical protein
MTAPSRNSRELLALQAQTAKAEHTHALGLDDSLDATAKPCTLGRHTKCSFDLVYGGRFFL